MKDDLKKNISQGKVFAHLKDKGYSDVVWMAAGTSKPVSMLKGNFGRLRYPFLGIFLGI